MQAGDVGNHPGWRVYIRENWSDGWVEASDGLTPLVARRAAGPSIGRAQLLYRFGDIKLEGETAFSIKAPLSLLDWYVKITTAAGAPIFIGTIAGDAKSHGSASSSGDESGDQELTAYGVEFLLDQVKLAEGWAEDADGNEIQIGHLPAFNERAERGDGPVGNRSSDRQAHLVGGWHAGDSYLFGEAGDVWTAADILEYLVVHYQPRDVRLGISGQYSALANIAPPRLDLSGRTLFEAINQLVDRRRGLGWVSRIEDPTGADPVVYIHVFSLLDTAVSDLPANAEQLGFDAGGIEPQALVSITATGQTYGKIRVLGERIRSMFSLGYQTDPITLDSAWPGDLQTAYSEAAGGTDALLNDRVRASDRFRSVYAFFTVPDGWDWKAGDGHTTASQYPANVNCEDDGSVTNASLVDNPSPIRPWRTARAFENRLLITEEQEDSSLPPELRPPFAVVKAANGKFVQLDNNPDPDAPSASLRVMDSEMTLEIRTNPNHVLGLPDFDFGVSPDAVPNAMPSQHSPRYEWRKLAVTVAVQLDERLRVIQEVDGQDPTRELVIEIPDAHLWVILPQTILRVKDDGTLEKFAPAGEDWGALYPAGCVTRNDAARLQSVAAMAAAWYGRERSAVSVRVREILDPTDANLPAVGTLITHVANAPAADIEVGTCVTEMEWDFASAVTTFATDYVELDLGR